MPESFDVIVVSHLLDRTLAPALVAALRPGGLLYYQTSVRVGDLARRTRDLAMLAGQRR